MLRPLDFNCPVGIPFELTRTHSFGSTSYELTGTVDLSQGVAVLGDADASGASKIFYLGQPEMGNINTSGGSDVEQR